MVKESDKFDPRLVWSNIRKVNVTPESVFKESDFAKGESEIRTHGTGKVHLISSQTR